MNSKPVYQLSARQVILLGITTALIAVGLTALIYTAAIYWQQVDNSSVSFAESSIASIPRSRSTGTDTKTGRWA